MSKATSALSAMSLIAGIALLGAAGAPLVTGGMIQSQFETSIDAISQETDIKAEIISYDKGLYQSHAQTRLSVTGLPQSVVVDHVIYHGPFIPLLLQRGLSPLAMAAVDSKLEINNPLWVSIAGSAKPVQMRTVVGLDKGVNGQFLMPGFQQKNEGETIRFSGFEGRFDSDVAGRFLKADFEMPGLQVSAPGRGADVGRMNVRADMQRMDSGLMTGSSQFELKDMEITGSGETVFDLKKLVMKARSEEAGGMMNSFTSIALSSFSAAGHEFGPGSLKLEFKGISVPVVQKLQALQRDMAASGGNDPQASMMLLGPLMELLPELLKTAEMNITELKLESDMGVVEGNLALSAKRFDPSMPLVHPVMLLGALDLDTHITISVEMLRSIMAIQSQTAMQASGLVGVDGSDTMLMDEMIGSQLMSLEQSGMLVRDGENYVTTISLHEGELMVNEKPIDLLSAMQGGGQALN